MTVTAPTQTLMDDGHIQLSASVRDKEYQPAPDAKVTRAYHRPERPLRDRSIWRPARTIPEPSTHRGPQRNPALIWPRSQPNAGLTIWAPAPSLSNASTEWPKTSTPTQNRELLQKLASETGGRYWRPDELTRLPTEISYSEAGISVRDIKELWNMPMVFLWLLALMAANGCCGASGVWYEQQDQTKRNPVGAPCSHRRIS